MAVATIHAMIAGMKFCMFFLSRREGECLLNCVIRIVEAMATYEFFTEIGAVATTHADRHNHG